MEIEKEYILPNILIVLQTENCTPPRTILLIILRDNEMVKR